ncbi:fatty-acyl-CoA synthase [Enhydrobacter aerosaccus]|uniref:Fatty-acyl-CoA synthase n=1 Tax=Enhydrobacter aerosaccus TaxID=225324 RepID=A0A1T4T901_9HYPH|nr:AMP-binding protein [Enhydrobacter aerosaccus]SKA36628.1 fatty-acyl-CoA synthase [Enhydrobacter aerosaccus]
MALNKPAADVWTLLAEWGEQTPDAPALLHGELSITFGELAERSLRVAQGLADLGVGAGDRVALWLPNVPAYLLLYFACARLGAIAVAVNTRYRAVEVADIVGRSGAKVLACAPGFRHIDFLSILAEVEPQALDSLTAIVIVGDEPATPPPAIQAVRRVPFDRLLTRPRCSTNNATARAACNIFTTSGTTSLPKFVAHRQGAIASHAQQVAKAFGFAANDTLTLSILPLCGVFGFNQTLATLAAGRPCVLVESYEIEQIARLIEHHRPTTLFGSDDMFARLLDLIPDNRPFPSVRWAGYAGFNTSLESIAERAEQRGLILRGLYGMSEVQALYAIQPVDAPVERRKKGGGIPTSPLAHVRVRDPETGTLLGVGQPGMLECAGPSLMVSYWGNEDATATAMTPDGYVRTGDLAALDGHGGFTFLSRMGDVLRLSGFLVNPLEIETHIQKLAGIEGCQTIAVARPDGVRAVSFVTLAPGQAFDESAVIDHCRHGLANYKVPLRVFTIDAFPTTPSANGFKIQRTKLRERAEELLRSSC